MVNQDKVVVCMRCVIRRGPDLTTQYQADQLSVLY